MATVDILRYTLELDSRRFVGQAKKAEKQTKRVTNAMGKMKGAVIGLATAYLGVRGLSMALKSTIGAFVKFEKEMANINTLLDITTVQFASLQKDILRIGRESPKALSDLTAATYDLISAGVEQTDVLWALNEAQKAAVGGSTSVKDAVKGSMGTLNAYNLEIGELTRIFDMQFNTVKRGVITFQELAMVIGRILPSASILGLSLEEVHAAMALITKKGLDAMESASALNMTFLALADPIKQEAFEKLGFKLWDMNNQFIGMDKFLKQINIRIDGMSDKSRTAFFGLLKLQGRAIKGFVNMVKAADEYKDLVGEMGETGEAERANKKMMDTITNQWASLASTVKIAFLEIGASHKDMINDIIDDLERLVTSKAFEDTITLFGVLLKTIGILSIAFVDMIGVMSFLYTAKVWGIEEALARIKKGTEDQIKLMRTYADWLDKIIKKYMELSKIPPPAPAPMLPGGVPAGAAGAILFPPITVTAQAPAMFSAIEMAFMKLQLSLEAMAPMWQGFLDGMISNLNDFTRQGAEMMMSLASGDIWSAGFFLGVNIIEHFFSDFSQKMQEVAERSRESMKRLREEIERNIQAIDRMTIAEREYRIWQLQQWITQLEGFIATGDPDRVQAYINALAGFREELESLLGSLSDANALRGIRSFQDLIAYLTGIGDLDFQTAQQIARYFGTMLDLSFEEQIELWEAMLAILEANGNLTADQLLSIDEILHNLYQQAEDQHEEIIEDIEDPDESQIMRSITMITEHQANLMVSILNSIYITLREFLEEFKNAAGSFNYGGMTGGSGTIGPIYVSGGVSANAIAESINREYRARGMKVGG